MTQILNYFENDPLKILYLIGGTGGIWFWVQEWRRRVRIRVRMVNGMINLAQSPNINVTVKVEVVNLGSSITSLEHMVEMTAFTAVEREKVAWSLNVVGADRSLEPHKAKFVELNGVCEASYPFTWYRTYRFRLTKGGDYVLRILNSSDKQLGPIGFFWRSLLFRWFGYASS